FHGFYVQARPTTIITSGQTECMVRMPNRTENEPTDRPIARCCGFARKIKNLEAFEFPMASLRGPGGSAINRRCIPHEEPRYRTRASAIHEPVCPERRKPAAFLRQCPQASGR